MLFRSEYHGQTIDIHGVLQPDGKTYRFLISSEGAEAVKDATLTAVADRQAAKVQIDGNTSSNWGQDEKFYDEVASGYTTGVTVSSSN